jgi:thiosulfate reductase cytochrome b subunit
MDEKSRDDAKPRSWPRRAAVAVLNFLKFGARADGAAPHVPFYRHTLPVRIMHWANAAVLAIMLMSGLQIFNAHPALYWGATSTFGAPAFSMTATRDAQGRLRGLTQLGDWSLDTTGLFGVSDMDGAPTVRGFPSWATLPGFQSLALGRAWHFFFAWLFAINGLAFAIYAIASGHLRELRPTSSDIKELPHEIVTHVTLRFPKGEESKHYNALQKVAYFGTVFVLGPLIVLTGLTMAPTIDAAFPELTWIFGGRQSARTIHFLCAFGFVLFFFVHIAMVVLSGTWNNVRAMLTGRYMIEREPPPPPLGEVASREAASRRGLWRHRPLRRPPGDTSPNGGG